MENTVPGSSRKRARTISPTQNIKEEPAEMTWQQDGGRQSPTWSKRGQVRCGHCKVKRATVCCMEEACVIFAEKKWQMTTLLVCSTCDFSIHNNPVMDDHLRTPLLIRGLTYGDDSTSNFETNEEKAQEGESVSVPQYIVVSANNSESPSGSGGAGPLEADQGEHLGNIPTFSGFTINDSFSLIAQKEFPREPVSPNNLDMIHRRYAHVLNYYLANRCSMTEAFRETNVARQTFMDTVGIAELRIVDPGRYQAFMDGLEMIPSRVGDIERDCRKIMHDHCKDKSMRLRGSKLLPLKLSVYV